VLGQYEADNGALLSTNIGTHGITHCYADESAAGCFLWPGE